MREYDEQERKTKLVYHFINEQELQYIAREIQGF